MSQYQQPIAAEQSGHQTGASQYQQATAGAAGTGGQSPQRAGSVPFGTRNCLSEETRSSTVALLEQLLADTADLASQVKYAHWNVKGMNFHSLHELFDEIAADLDDHADEIAERITALGGRAGGTVRMSAANSRVPEMDTTATSGAEFVSVLADRLAVHDANLLDALDRSAAAGDSDTTDLLNEISRDVATSLWFLEAHLQGSQGPDGTGQGFQGQQFQYQGPLQNQR